MRFSVFKRLRCERGLLQIELAQRTRIERSRLSFIENLHIAPTPNELVRLAKALNVPLSDLEAASLRPNA